MKSTVIIGIAGGSGSGKSTFAVSLHKARINDKCDNCLIIPMDSHYKPKEQLTRSAAPVTGKIYADYNCLSSIDLTRLKQDLDEKVKSGNYKVIIIEGLFALWDKEIRERLDLKLFVECSADERIVRRLKRNMEWGQSFEAITGVYLDLVRYRHDEYVLFCKSLLKALSHKLFFNYSRNLRKIIYANLLLFSN